MNVIDFYNYGGFKEDKIGFKIIVHHSGNFSLFSYLSFFVENKHKTEIFTYEENVKDDLTEFMVYFLNRNNYDDRVRFYFQIIFDGNASVFINKNITNVLENGNPLTYRKEKHITHFQVDTNKANKMTLQDTIFDVYIA